MAKKPTNKKKKATKKKVLKKKTSPNNKPTRRTNKSSIDIAFVCTVRCKEEGVLESFSNEREAKEYMDAHRIETGHTVMVECG